ncbi:flagellar basal-body rod protein FlgG [Hahella sp. CCB-MM4]|uniref:flagellar basal-body rod protein FlgG n=1 Tax=Hahella sp. (strain CCB-MM4) TaxID=1926491 RepID=UPI000B9C1059|nr:flagellar basal-body rod protein FlgG [Hahella sp. CCB-MM4]OZG73856.1 flagellar basal-body rod protein FlgG [Hahella sp. CCB-MM4]
MHGALWVSKTGLAAQDTALKTISNNLANVNTNGFKRDRAVFQDLLYQIKTQPGGQSSQNTEIPSGLQLGTGVRVVGTQKVFTEGNLEVTEQPLDVAINGRGFFQILMPDGTISYTRDGQFHMDSEGNIVTANGYPLEPSITVPDNATNITISTDGIVSVTVPGTATPTQIGTISLADFVNPAGLEATGNNLFVQTGSSGDPQEGTPGLDGLGSTEQGMIETSNVEIVEEMVDMITTQRAYEMNAKVVTTADQMLQYVTQNL